MYGKEYFFGGGLQSMPHEQFVQMHGGVGPTEYIELGFSDLSQVCVCLCAVMHTRDTRSHVVDIYIYTPTAADDAGCNSARIYST